jgi:GMP synthase (glutamine-hydrolysing)
LVPKPVLCVRNDPTDRLGIVPDLLREEGLDVTTIDGFAPGVAWPGRADLSGLVVFGGEMNADQIDRYPYLLQLRNLMREAGSAGVPTLGICLGAQLLARAYDGPVRLAPVREFGFVPVSLTQEGSQDPVLCAFGPQSMVFQWHEDTFDVPAGATLLATGSTIKNQAFRVGATSWGTQFHLEVEEKGLDEWLDLLGDQLERKWMRKPADVREEMRQYLAEQKRRAGQAIGGFAHKIRGGA